jgi:peptide-methionine (S)-S-oxide reductase
MPHPLTKTAPVTVLSRRRLVVAGAALVLLGGAVARRTWASSEARVLPAFKPGAGEVSARPAATSEVAVLAGGCFWGVQGVFQHVRGVASAVSGYAGGEKRTATYDAVGRGNTGHAEAVEITFDPREIGYARLLQIFFSVAHDPTQRDRQGPDVGPQYRSAIFPVNDAQARVATAYIAQLDQARAFQTPIVTKIEPGRPFYWAEGYHQDFLTLNPRHPYIVANDLPKIADLKRVFPDAYRPEPALVSKMRKPPTSS